MKKVCEGSFERVSQQFEAECSDCGKTLKLTIRRLGPSKREQAIGRKAEMIYRIPTHNAS